jgi:hypothetical protein
LAVKFSCRCPEKNEREFRKQHWKVLQYKFNKSAFNGYRKEESDYSTVQCDVCGSVGRTKGKYVDEIYFGLLCAVYALLQACTIECLIRIFIAFEAGNVTDFI